MEERILIKSERYNTKKALIIFLCLCAVIFLVLFIEGCVDGAEDYDFCYNEYLNDKLAGSCGWYYESWELCSACESYLEHPQKISFVLSRVFRNNDIFVYCDFLLILIGVLIYLWLRSYELTITDKRAYGKTAWGKRVDLPLDSISAVGVKWPKGISVGTSSGRISFLLIKNRDEIHKCVSDLLIERQSKVISNTTVTQKVSLSSAGELKEYKDLLDSGIITQEEFDAKKKQLLGL